MRVYYRNNHLRTRGALRSAPRKLGLVVFSLNTHSLGLFSRRNAPQSRPFRHPVLVVSVGGVGGRGSLWWICKREKNEDAGIRVFWSPLQRNASLYTETRGKKSADGAGGRILKRPSDETEFSGYPRPQGGKKNKKHQIEFIATEYPLFPL